MLYLGIPEIESGGPFLETSLLKEFKKTNVTAAEIRRLFTPADSGPSIFLFQIGAAENKRVFGAYASRSWSEPGPHFGTESCFLFVMVKNGERIKLRVNPNPPNNKKCLLWHNGSNSLSFGQTDLVLGEDVHRFN